MPANLDRLLLAAGYDLTLADAIGRFLKAVVWGAPALLGFAVLRGVLAALSRTRPVMVVLMCCVPANAILNWMLIYGRFGAPRLGIVGSGLASALVAWLIFGALASYIGAAPGLAWLRRLPGAVPRDWRDVPAMLRLGAPMGGHLTLEAGVFVAVGVIMGRIGADAVGANQIVLNLATMTYMVPLGLAHAATVRCAFELGAGRSKTARRAGFVALGIGASFMALAAAVMLTAPTAIVAIYIDVADPANQGIITIALRLITIAALFQVFDGVQTVAVGALRGYKDTARPMLLALIGYWGCGFIAGCVLAFPLERGGIGLWWGLALGTAAVAMLVTARFWRVSRPVTRSP